MAVTKAQYKKMSDYASPPTKSHISIPCAFLFGGGICVAGELLKNCYMNYFGNPEALAGTLSSISLIFIASLMTAIGIFDDFAKVARAGALIPITGFSNAMSAAAQEFKSEGFILGLGAKMFVIAGPVIVYGTIASVFYGIIAWIFKLY